MGDDIEKRLHRVRIKLNNVKLKCPFSKRCNMRETSYRCNQFYEKCTLYKTLSKLE
jgi:hypothetical protein